MTTARGVLSGLVTSLVIVSIGLGNAQDPFDVLAQGLMIAVAVPHARGGTGEEVEVPIAVKSAHGLGCLQMALLYDETLIEVTEVNPGPLLGEHAIVEHDDTVPGRLGLGFLSGRNANSTQLTQVAGDGPVFIIRFKVLGRAGQRSPLTPHRPQAWQVTDDKLEVRAQPGEFLITGGFPWLYLLLGVLLTLVIAATVMTRRHRPAVASPATGNAANG